MRSLGVLLVDIDDFKKKINDRYGHPVGDKVLRAVAQTIQANTRAEDFCARYGGEEFAVMVIDPKEETFKEIAERLRKAVEELKIEGLPPITISIGGTSYQRGEEPKDFVGRADRALYVSKNEGRNRVTII